MPIRVFDPHLRAGWESDTPVTDSLLRRFLINWTLGIEAQGIPLGGKQLQRDDLAAVDVGRPGFGTNVATLLAPLFPEDVEEVENALENFYAFSAPSVSGDVFLFSPWPTPDLHPYGWTIVDHPPMMLRPPGGVAPPPPPGLRIETVKDEQSLRAFEVAIVRGFTMPEVERQGPGAAFSTTLLHDERQRMWIGWEGDIPVSAAATFVAADLNDVTLVATVPEARHRGYGVALTWQAILAEPTLPALLIATEEGRPLYEQMGYISLFRWTMWQRNRSGNLE